MNIRDKNMWPDELPSTVCCPGSDSVLTLLSIRAKTYQGFAEIEQSKGFLTPTALLHLPKSQEMVRILMLRGIEECLEAAVSGTRDHYREEMIDALNFWMSIFILDNRVDLHAIANMFMTGWMTPRVNLNVEYSQRDLLWEILLSMNSVLEKLRNRPWQHNAQSTYYDGTPEVINFAGALGNAMSLVFGGDWDSFARFFIAKDNVLQFRLRTLY